jgi:hypothetical protein
MNRHELPAFGADSTIGGMARDEDAVRGTMAVPRKRAPFPDMALLDTN